MSIVEDPSKYEPKDSKVRLVIKQLRAELQTIARVQKLNNLRPIENSLQ